MKTIQLFKPIAVATFMLTTAILFGQKKYNESFSVADDVLVSVNTSHTNVIFETWNKNKVEVEAYIDGDKLSEAEKEELFKNWDFEVLGNNKKVVITSSGGMQWPGAEALSGMPLLNLEFIGPLIEQMPMMYQFDFNMPPLPKDLLEDVSAFQFDYEAFKKDEEGYMKKFEKQVEKKFGKDFEKKMEAWGEEFAKAWNEKKGDKMTAEWEAKMEAWGKEFEVKMEQWEQTYGKDIEKWAEEMELKYGDDEGNFQKRVITTPNGDKTIIIKHDKDGSLPSTKPKAKRTIIIKMPKNAKTEINVRHGEIKMADVFNINATLNHSPFTANSIDGGKTLINAAYAPVVVNTWKEGTLVVKFINDCRLNTVETIHLKSNSSNVNINRINENAKLTGSFGNILINTISNSFETIEIALENTDANITLPDTAFTFDYNGMKSTLLYPKSLQLSKSKKNDRVYLNGFNQKADNSRSLTINATYSNVKLQ